MTSLRRKSERMSGPQKVYGSGDISSAASKSTKRCPWLECGRDPWTRTNCRWQGLRRPRWTRCWSLLKVVDAKVGNGFNKVNDTLHLSTRLENIIYVYALEKKENLRWSLNSKLSKATTSNKYESRNTIIIDLIISFNKTNKRYVESGKFCKLDSEN